MDAVRDRFAGPYTLRGKPITARPMFRMNGGMNEPLTGKEAARLGAICRARGLDQALGNCKSGRPSPEELRAVTQALIDANELVDAPGGDATSIRQMQWRFGIGVDCAGYVMEAMKGAHPHLKFSGAERYGDIFRPMEHDRRFGSVSVADVKTGDVIHLEPPGGGVPHNVIVRSHETVGDHSRSELIARLGPGAIGALRTGVHVLEVDSSWGADRGMDYGGFRRDTWIFDPNAKQGERWSYFSQKHQTFVRGVVGPQGEAVTGCYRPKAVS